MKLENARFGRATRRELGGPRPANKNKKIQQPVVWVAEVRLGPDNPKNGRTRALAGMDTAMAALGVRER